jgi:hypothetical protein
MLRIAQILCSTGCRDGELRDMFVEVTQRSFLGVPFTVFTSVIHLINFRYYFRISDFPIFLFYLIVILMLGLTFSGQSTSAMEETIRGRVERARATPVSSTKATHTKTRTSHAKTSDPGIFCIHKYYILLHYLVVC